MGPPDSSSNKTDRHDITEIILKITLYTKILTPFPFFFQTLILCHPSHNGCDLLEQEFNRCMGILSSASNTGYVLPGYARTEEFMSHFLTDLTGKLHIFVGSVLRPCF